MLKVILGFLAAICWLISQTLQTAVVRYSGLEQLDKAEELITPMWISTSATALLVASAVVAYLFERRHRR